MTGMPLAGWRILVTRSAQQAGKLSSGLKALGAIPVEVPLLDIAPPRSFAALDEALRQIRQYDWVIFTSANTVQSLAARGKETGVDPPREFTGNVAAVGSATASAARDAGWNVTLIPDSYVAESLVSAFPDEGVRGRRFLLARAEVARDVIPDVLRQAGALVDVVDAYRNVIPETAPARLRDALAEGLDAATFTSSSSVTHLAEAANAAGIEFPFTGIRAISIGPITSATLREWGWEPAIEADPHNIAGLVAATAKLLGRR